MINIGCEEKVARIVSRFGNGHEVRSFSVQYIPAGISTVQLDGQVHTTFRRSPTVNPSIMPIARQAQLAERASVDLYLTCGISVFVSKQYTSRGPHRLTFLLNLFLLLGLLDLDGSCQPDRRHLRDALEITLLVLIFTYVVAEFNEARTTRKMQQLRRSWKLHAKENAR